MSKINLEDIFMEYAFNMNKPELLQHKINILNIMKEACNKAIDLCAKNASMIDAYTVNHIDKNSILNVKKLII